MSALGTHSTLGYCTNVHPTRSAQDILKMLRTECGAVRGALKTQIKTGVGLWLSAARLREFQEPSLFEALADECQKQRAGVFTWNAFPYGDFHQERVKERVYAPNWSEAARLQYTLDLMDFVARLRLGNTEVSISTLPVAGAGFKNEDQVRMAVHHLVRAVVKSLEIEDQFGILVHLDLEPEPGCFLETSEDVLRFFKEYLLPCGTPQLQKQLGLSREIAEAQILDKLRICYDTCHAAVMFESPASILLNYEKLGIRIGKVQISSGLIYRPADAQGTSLLKDLAHDRYLHQVVGRNAEGKKESFLDLDEALASWEVPKTLPRICSSDLLTPLSEYRIHYHVPIFLKQWAQLGTTQSHLLELFKIAKTQEITRHWEVETYTWSVLPPGILSGEQDLPSGIAQEINWVAQMTQDVACSV